MTAEGAKEFEALEAQAASLMTLFSFKGYERVAPAFIQPASLFLDRIGEALRARTYIFTDPNGEELCLRPDLTIPVARVSWSGAARSWKRDPVKWTCFPRAGRQARPLEAAGNPDGGIEYFGVSGVDADLEVLALTIEAVRQSGVTDFTVRTGHLGLFNALLNALAIPERWRGRLRRAFWRHSAFARELAILSQVKPNRLPSAPPAALDETGLLDHLDASGIPFIGLGVQTRSRGAFRRRRPTPASPPFRRRRSSSLRTICALTARRTRRSTRLKP